MVSTYKPRIRAFGRVLSLLENLKSTEAGTALFQHIAESFQTLENSQFESEKLYLDLLHNLLNSLTPHFPAGSEQWMQLRIMQSSLQESMTEPELEIIQGQAQQLIAQVLKDGNHGQKSMQDTINSLLGDTSPNDGIKSGTSPDTKLEPSSDINWSQTLLGNIAEKPTPLQSNPQLNAVEDIENNTENAPFCFVDQTRSDIQRIHTGLSDQISNARQLNSALAKLLHSSFATINNLGVEDDINQVKNSFLRRYAKLIKLQQGLATKFQNIDDNLHNIESSSKNLKDELTRVHRLSLTDELTQLPNRRAFLMRLDDEISRALRFDYPLTMALIDIDNFKPINDNFGHAAGDVILRHFAQNMNVVFRYHDMATRYGGEEFAVLFPNTSIRGALSALGKLQYKLKVDPYILVKNEDIPVPTFSAGIALYSPGEDADEIIRRADIAMYKAKTSGRDRIEIDPLGVKQLESMYKDNTGKITSA